MSGSGGGGGGKRSGASDKRAGGKAPASASKRRKRSKNEGTDFLAPLLCDNALPGIPLDPKLLTPAVDASSYYRFAHTSLEKEQMHKLWAEGTLGIHVNLVDAAQLVPPQEAPPLDVADEQLLSGASARRKSLERRTKGKEVNWLRRTVYMSGRLATKKKDKKGIEEQQLELRMKRMRAAGGASADDGDENSISARLAQIERSFAAVQGAPVHPDKNVQPVKEMPLFPSFDLWPNEYSRVQFDVDPVEDFLTANAHMANTPERRAFLAHHGVVKGFTTDAGEFFVSYLLPKLGEAADKDTAATPATDEAEAVAKSSAITTPPAEKPAKAAEDDLFGDDSDSDSDSDAGATTTTSNITATTTTPTATADAGGPSSVPPAAAVSTEEEETQWRIKGNKPLEWVREYTYKVEKGRGDKEHFVLVLRGDSAQYVPTRTRLVLKKRKGTMKLELRRPAAVDMTRRAMSDKERVARRRRALHLEHPDELAKFEAELEAAKAAEAAAEAAAAARARVEQMEKEAREKAAQEAAERERAAQEKDVSMEDAEKEAAPTAADAEKEAAPTTETEKEAAPTAADAEEAAPTTETEKEAAPTAADASMEDAASAPEEKDVQSDAAAPAAEPTTKEPADATMGEADASATTTSTTTATTSATS